jgi:hypothetical protein
MFFHLSGNEAGVPSASRNTFCNSVELTKSAHSLSVYGWASNADHRPRASVLVVVILNAVTKYDLRIKINFLE